MTAEERATGYCEVCHRRLRDPISIARKKGRTCWKKTAKKVQGELFPVDVPQDVR